MNGVVMLLCCVVVVMAMVVPMMAENAPRRRVLNAVARRRQQTWENWKRVHGKHYAPWEEMYRQRVFFQNMWASMRHNARYPVSVSYTRGINQFSDMTLDEYKAYNRLMPNSPRRNGICHSAPLAFGDESLPDTVDWRTKGYVTAVKNQGQCGSCWAFSTTGSVEGQHFNKTKHLLSLSEQQLVDCSGPDGNHGCEGGLMDQGFEYIMSQPGGLETEAEYPYTATDGNCSAQSSKEKAKITGCYDLPEGDEQALKRAVALVGPISVAIDASHSSFQSYDGGVYYEPDCSSTQLDHGVLVAGYGTYQGTPYWLVKNSWGVDWGVNGYIMMSRNRNNNCGIASMPSYPVA